MQIDKDARYPTIFTTEAVNIAIVNDLMLVNNFHVEVGFFATQANQLLHQIAVDKVDIFFQMLVTDSLIISSDDYKKLSFNMLNNIIELPSTLGDQAIASVLFLKLLSIVGDDLDIHYLSLESSLGSGLKHTITSGSPELSMLVMSTSEWWKDKELAVEGNSKPWWLRSDAATVDYITDDGELFSGNFKWDDLFSDELAQLKPKKKTLKVIPGGKNET
jgi:hypothetical protein